MRRFLFSFALLFAAGLLGVLRNPASAEFLLLHAPTCIWLAAFAILIAHSFQKPLAACMIAGLAAGILYTAGYQQLLVQPIHRLSGETMMISAKVRSYPDVYENNQRVEVSIPKNVLNGFYPKSNFSAIGYLPLTEEPLKPGDTLEALVSFYEPDVRQGFDRQRYQMANGNWISFSILKNRETKEPAHFTVTHAAEVPWYALPQSWSRTLGERILQQFPEREGGFLYSLLLGNRSALDALDAQNLQKAGLSHIIAVSGMHLMFLIGLMQRLFSRRIGTVLSFAAIVLFIPMAGGSPSILRAGIMAALSGFAFLMERESDAQTSLGVSLLVLLALNPYSIFHLSLQLSFLSTFGILRYAGWLEDKLFHRIYARTKNRIGKKLSHVVGASLGCSLCAMFFTAPILISTFGYITLLSIPANIITLGVISLTFSLGVFFCLLPIHIPYLTTVLTALSDFILDTAQKLGKLHWGILYWEEMSGKIAILAVLALIILLLMQIKPRFTVPLCLCVLVGAAGYAHVQHCSTTRVTLHDVGEGQMISVADGYDTFSLIDCGSAFNRDGTILLQETMNWYGFRQIDTMILTAVDKAHARSAAQVLETIPVGRLIIPNHLKENDTLLAVQQAADRHQVPITVWETAGISPVSISGIASAQLAGGIDRKLGVHLQDNGLDVWILHSMTQNMLAALLSQSQLSAKEVILANQFQKQNLLEDALTILRAEKILLSSGYSSARTLFGVPVVSTKDAGDIVWKILHTEER